MTSIGVFDSGLGGLTVVRQLRQALPSENILYLGDTARVPYGTKSPRTVERYALTCQQFLLKHPLNLVMVACNTASANALPAMAKVSPVPVIGAVEPGAMSALQASRSKQIAVLGTLGTIASGAYERAILASDKDAKVVALACPLFVPLAEEGWGDTDIALAVAKRYLEPLFAEHNSVDTLVLGCTHYPLLREVIAQVCESCCAHPVAIVDSASAMAKLAQKTLQKPDRSSENNLSRGSLQCFVTDASRMQELAPRFLGEEVHSVQLVDL